jgi:uncharacterized phage protein (TIGR01671 family)
MRPIKFRAWDLEQKCWIGTNGTTFTGIEPTEGVVALILNGHLRVFSTHCYDADPDITGSEPMHSTSHSEYESVHPCKTDPSYKRQYELMQFTGLKDKNGKEIFEGDLLKHHDTKDLGNTMVEVVYKDYGFFFRELWKREYPEAINMPADMGKYFEVIGNIYSSPELIEKDGH